MEAQQKTADQSKRRKRRTKTRRASKEELGLGGDLTGLDDDIELAEDSIKTDQIQLSNRKEVVALGALNKVDAKSLEKPNIYVEKRDRFQPKSITEYEQKERRLATNEPIFVSLVDTETNIGINFAIGISKVMERFGVTCLGLFAGLALAHTLLIQGMFSRQTISASGFRTFVNDNGLSLLQFYAPFAEAFAITYHVVFIVTLLSIFFRYDLGSISRICISQCVSFQIGALSIIILFTGFAIHNSMYFLTYQVLRLGWIPTENIVNLFTEDSFPQSQLRTWMALDIARTAFIVLSWLIVALTTAFQDDRMQENLIHVKLNEKAEVE